MCAKCSSVPRVGTRGNMSPSTREYGEEKWPWKCIKLVKISKIKTAIMFLIRNKNF